MKWFDFKDEPPKNTMLLVYKTEDGLRYYGIFNSDVFLKRNIARNKLDEHKYEIQRPERAEPASFAPKEWINGIYTHPTKENCNWRDESKILTDEKIEEYKKLLDEDLLLERDVVFIHVKWTGIYKWTYLSELDRYFKEDGNETIVKSLDNIAHWISRID